MLGFEARTMRVAMRIPILAAQFEAVAAGHGADVVHAPDAASLHGALADADALWIWPAYYDAALARVLERDAPRLRWIQLMTMGYDQVLEHGAPHGATITNAGDSYAPTVAEHAVTLLLALVRRVPEMVARSGEGVWDQSVTARIGTLNGASVAVLGFGNIGREIATRLRGFGARVIAVTRSGREDVRADESASITRLHDVLARVDAVIVALPLDASTRGLIDARALAALRPHAVLVNIARGPIVEGAALRDALASGRIGGAGLDVTDPEPLPAGDPLWTMPNTIVTPHVAGYGGDVPARRVLALVERNLRAFIEGGELEAQIPRDQSPSALRTAGR